MKQPIDHQDTGEDVYGWVAEGLEVRRLKRRRMLAFGGAAAAVLVGGLGVFGLLALVRDGGSGSPTREATGVTIATAPIQLSWSAVPGTLGYSESLLASPDGTFYALSTAPGRNVRWPAPKALYTSTDGEHWDAAVLADDISANDMALRSGVVYLIGTAPAFGAAGAPGVAISSSDDGGVGWDSVVLPLAELPALGVDSFANTSMHIAADDRTVVAVVQRTVEFDYWSLVPQGLLELGNRGVQPTTEGVEVVDYGVIEEASIECEQAIRAAGLTGDEDPANLPEPCPQLYAGLLEPSVIESFTWEELGFAEGAIPSRSEVFVSSDGADFELVDAPFVPGQHLADLLAFGDGFLAMEWSFEGRMTMWESPDGRSWQALEQPPVEWVSAAGIFRGDRVMIGGRQGRPAVLWEDEAGGWTEVDLAGTLGDVSQEQWITSAAVGPLGVFAVIQGFDEVRGEESVQVIHGVAPDDWELVSLEGVVGIGSGYSDWVVVGRDAVLLRFTQFQGGPEPVNLQVVGSPVS